LQQLPEVQEKWQLIMSAQYEAWASMPLPILNGATPEQAVKNPDGREKVEALVLQLERDSQRRSMPLNGQVLGRLRERLGLVAGPR
jgi:hypothetical protein